ncbi:flagellar basal body-associated FliL family protein [Shewanella sp. A25]|nr:flagellar basal body-associated FliL family protein [Shewanella shenzhenensis]
MKLVLMILGAILLIGAGVAGGAYYMNNQAEKEVVAEPPLQYYPLSRFVVSVSDDLQSRYLVLQLSLATKDPLFLEELKTKAPLLRNVLVKRFTNTTREQAKQTLEDVTVLQQELLEQFNLVLEQPKAASKLEQVLVTDVFLQ